MANSVVGELYPVSCPDILPTGTRELRFEFESTGPPDLTAATGSPGRMQFYLVLSVACFVVYAVDKSAAVVARWRVPENTLLLLGLAGGWPGAIVAQQVLRHKTKKASFRQAFWGTVALNLVAFVVIFSPLLPGMLAG